MAAAILGSVEIASGSEGVPMRPFIQRPMSRPEVVEVELLAEAFVELRDRVNGARGQVIEVPGADGEAVILQVRRFEVFDPDARFVSASGEGFSSQAPPEMLFLRGFVLGDAASHAYLALDFRGSIHGYVQRSDGSRFFVVSDARRHDGGLALPVEPGFVEYCGMGIAGHPRLIPHGSVRSAPLLGAPQMARVAVDADLAFVQLFPDDAAAQAYVAAVIGAVSDIYIRDFDVRLLLSFVRTWPGGGEPFGADSLTGFEEYWVMNEDPSPYNLIHLMSGRRDTFYGGIAYLADPCSGFGYGISAFMLGSFPAPVTIPNLGNWDVVVVAHEMGHNMGTGHTHDSYEPPIDQCGSAGTWSRSDIMSYCHTTAGGLLNTDMRFHARVQEVIAASVAVGGCLPFDCNGNSVSDAEDITALTSADGNGNGVPDECEDCNGNAILDSIEIAGGMADVNVNGIPDICEADCNANALPDEFEVTNATVFDANGNLIPDGCEPDCDGNFTADHTDLAVGTHLDLDRNSVPDVCQDCNANGEPDYIDVGRQGHVYVADLAGFVREYQGAAGVAVQSLGTGIVGDAYDLVFGPDRRAYVAAFAGDRVLRLDPVGETVVEFVSAGSGGLDGPAGLAFGADGRLYVSSQLTHQVLRYDGATGGFVDVFVSAGSGGLTGPFGLTFNNDGNLWVTGSDSSVREYSGVNGAFLQTMVSPGEGGLDGPRAVLAMPDGRLLVSSHLTDDILEYDAGGNFLRVFNGPYPMTSVWGMRIGPNGNVYAGRHTGAKRIIEFDAVTGLYIRSLIRGDTEMLSPTGFDFCPPALNDCNQNDLPDACDIASGTSLDADLDGIPDECGCVPLAYGDVNLSGAVDVDDILCVLDAFVDMLLCPLGDLVPCGGNGLIDVDDILAMLEAFSGNPLCPPPCQ